jgi:hypothetical protein
MDKKKNLNKKGLITIFIIVGMILLLFTGIFIYYVNSKKNDIIVDSNLDILPIKNYIESLLESSVKSAVIEISKNGGYSDESLNEMTEHDDYMNTKNGFSFIFGIKDNENKIPEKEEIQNEIANRTLEIFKESLNLTHFNELFFVFIDLEKAKEESNIEITISNNSIFVILDFNLIVEKDKTRTTIQKFRKEIIINFGELLYVANHIINELIIYELIDIEDLGYCGDSLLIRYYTPLGNSPYILIKTIQSISENYQGLHFFFGMDDNYEIIECS